MKRRIVDLTIPIESGMQTFKALWHPSVEITQLGRHEIEGRETRRLTIGTHSGTHMDAPLHFIKGGLSVEQISLETLIGPATIVDLTWVEDSQEISEKLLAKAIGNRDHERLILYFGWDNNLGLDLYFTNHAFLSIEASRYLVKKGCRLLAMDTPQPDNPLNSQDSGNDAPIHKELLGKGIILVEYLRNIASLNVDQVELIVAPINLMGGDGAPARCFAIEYY